MPTVAQIENADVLTASQATRLVSLLKASERYRSAPVLYGDLDNRIWAKVGRKFAITAASNATPIVITAADHSFAVNDPVEVVGIAGNAAANGSWVLAAVTTNTATLKGSSGNGAYTSGGYLIDYRSKLLAAIVEALEGSGDSTVALRGGRDGVDFSEVRDREHLLAQALDALYTSSEQAVSAGVIYSYGSFSLRNVPVW